MNRTKRQDLSVTITRIESDLLLSPSEMTPEPAHFVRSTEKTALKLYESYCNEFYAEGVTYTRQILLKSLAVEWQMQHSMPFKETYKIISTVASTLLFNEVEIVYWSLLLKVRHEGTKPALYAYFTGYQTKCALNNETYPFEVCLNSIIPNFRVHFNNWQLVQDYPTEISPKDMNSRLLQLNEMYCKGVKDYESMVKQLMQIPRRKESFMSESLLSDLDLDPSILVEHKEEEFEELIHEAENSPID